VLINWQEAVTVSLFALVAVIVTVPDLINVTTPFAFTVAIEVSLETYIKVLSVADTGNKTGYKVIIDEAVNVTSLSNIISDRELVTLIEIVF
jgi:hypothetical protein